MDHKSSFDKPLNATAKPYVLPELCLTDVNLDVHESHPDHDLDSHSLPDVSLTDVDLDLDLLIPNHGVDSYIPEDDDSSLEYEDSVAESWEDGSEHARSRWPTPPPSARTNGSLGTEIWGSPHPRDPRVFLHPQGKLVPADQTPMRDLEAKPLPLIPQTQGQVSRSISKMSLKDPDLVYDVRLCIVFD